MTKSTSRFTNTPTIFQIPFNFFMSYVLLVRKILECGKISFMKSRISGFDILSCIPSILQLLDNMLPWWRKFKRTNWKCFFKVFLWKNLKSSIVTRHTHTHTHTATPLNICYTWLVWLGEKTALLMRVFIPHSHKCD